MGCGQVGQFDSCALVRYNRGQYTATVYGMTGQLTLQASPEEELHCPTDRL